MSKLKKQESIFSKYAQQKYSVYSRLVLFVDVLLKISTSLIELFALTYEKNMTIQSFLV